MAWFGKKPAATPPRMPELQGPYEMSGRPDVAPVEVIEPVKPVRLKEQALLQRWQDVTFRIQDHLNAALDNKRSADVKAYAIAAGVATDKVLVLAGRPTSIVAGLHEVRHSLPHLAATLSRIASKLDDPESKEITSGE